MLHLKEAIGHFSLVKPYYIYRPCPVRQVAIGKAGDADGGAEVFQRLFEALAVLVLGWDIGRKVAHVANLYEQALLKTMCKALVVFPFFALNVKLTHYLVATFLQGPKSRLYFEYIIRLLHDPSDRFVRCFCRPRFRVDKMIQVAERSVSATLA